MAEDLSRKRYSVYRVADDMPIILYATARECAEALGIKYRSFLMRTHRGRYGKHRARKYVVCEDEKEDEDGA